MSKKKQLDEILNKYENIIVTKEGCQFCKHAKNLLNKKGITYKEFSRDDNEDLSDEILERYGLRTVPKIFINKEYVGGCDSLINFFRTM